MRTISRTTQFKKDYKRESKGQHRTTLDDTLIAAVILLVNNSPLPDKLRDHPLSGDWKDHRDCHLKPDLLLIYRLPNDQSLELIRLGSHSELGL